MACDHQLCETVPAFYLYKLCDDALGNTVASLCSEMVPHQVAHPSNTTGSDGDLEEDTEVELK